MTDYVHLRAPYDSSVVVQEVAESVGVWTAQGWTVTTDPVSGSSGPQGPVLLTNTVANDTYPSILAAQRKYPLTEKAGKARRLVLDNNCIAGYSETYIQPRQVILGPDGKYYLQFTGTGPSGNAICIASATTPEGPFTNAKTLVTARYLGWIVTDDAGTWYLFCSNGSDCIRYTSTSIDGTYTSSTTVVTKSATSTDWDSSRIMEFAVYRDPRLGQTGWLLFYMGISITGSPQTEQIGLATAPTLGGTWTKATSIATPPAGQTAGTGLIIPCTGVSTDFDGKEVSEPFMSYWGGDFYLWASCTWWGSAAGTGYLCLWTATDPINGPWTRRGIVLERQPWPAADACAVNTGSFFHKANGDILYTYQASRQSLSYASATSNAYQLTIDGSSFVHGPITSPWKRVEAESTDTRVVKTGAWANEAFVGDSGANDAYTNTIGDKIAFTASCSRVRVGSQAASYNGIVSVALDGVTVVGNLDMYVVDGGGTNLTPVLIYDSGELPPGLHTVTVTLTGKNASSAGGYLVADYFEYVPVSG